MKKKLEEILVYMEAMSRFGTDDTEPRAMLRWVIRNAMNGEDYWMKPPLWQTFTSMPGGIQVARKLNRLGRELHNIIRENLDPINYYLDS